MQTYYCNFLFKHLNYIECKLSLDYKIRLNRKAENEKYISLCAGDCLLHAVYDLHCRGH